MTLRSAAVAFCGTFPSSETLFHAVEYAPDSGMEEIQQASDQLIHFSRANMLSGVRKLVGYDGLHKSVIIPLGSEMPVIAQDKKELRREYTEFRIREDDVVFLYVGRVVESKGVTRLSKAFPVIEDTLRRHYGKNAKLIIVGNKGNNEIIDEMKRDFDPCSDKVHFAGYVSKPEKLARYYLMADMVLIPSNRESFCLAALDAMLLNRPVGITNNFGPRELFVSQGLARGMETNIESIIRTGLWFAGNPLEVNEMITRAEEAARTKYSLSVSIAQQSKFYLSAISAGKENIQNYTQAVKAMREGRSREALELFQKVTDRDLKKERDLVGRFNYGHYQKYKKNEEKARELFESVVGEDPLHRQAYFELGVIEYHAGKIAKAEEHLKSAVELDENHAESNQLLALCYEASSDSTKRRIGLEYRSKALKENPKIERAIGELLKKRKEH